MNSRQNSPHSAGSKEDPVHTTLVFLRDDIGRILLANKLRGFGMGKLNGFGGKIKEGETALENAVREVREECGVDVSASDLTEVAFCKFYFESGLTIFNQVYIVNTWHGKLHETEEMGEFQWYAPDELPFGHMWADDRLWLPYALSGTDVQCEFWFAADNETIAQQAIEMLEKN